MLINGCDGWNSIQGWKDSCLRQGSNLGLLDQQASAQSTELPGILIAKGTLMCLNIKTPKTINFPFQQMEN